MDDTEEEASGSYLTLTSLKFLKITMTRGETKSQCRSVSKKVAKYLRGSAKAKHCKRLTYAQESQIINDVAHEVKSCVGSR